jgi:hypothetical protein
VEAAQDGPVARVGFALPPDAQGRTVGFRIVFE